MVLIRREVLGRGGRFSGSEASVMVIVSEKGSKERERTSPWSLQEPHGHCRRTKEPLK